MSVETKIVEMVNDIEPSEFKVTVRMVSWPYSRKLVKGVCEHLGLEYDRTRIDKRFEEFSIQAAGSIEATFKEMLKLINKQARDSGNSVAKERNVIVERIVNQLNGEDEAYQTEAVEDEEDNATFTETSSDTGDEDDL